MRSVVGSHRILAGTLTALAWSGFVLPAAAQAPSPELLAAYQTFYRGDNTAADDQFQQVVVRRPDDLGALFGELLVAHARLVPETPPSLPFEQRLDAFIDKASTRYEHNRSDDEALFHLAFACMLRSVYKFEHQKGILSAARDGARARDYVDAYLKRHPDNGDAHLVRGLYNYFVDLAPSFVHIVRFLLFLPGGNRVTGLQDIEFAAAHGLLFGRLAQLQLVGIYGALEGRPAEAIALGVRLERDLPANDDVAFALADVYISPAVEERDEAGRVYDSIVDRHRSDVTPDGIARLDRAWYGLAGARFEAWRCDEALAILTRVL